jgi:hypothetical protein
MPWGCRQRRLSKKRAIPASGSVDHAVANARFGGMPPLDEESILETYGREIVPLMREVPAGAR